MEGLFEIPGGYLAFISWPKGIFQPECSVPLFFLFRKLSILFPREDLNLPTPRNFPLGFKAHILLCVFSSFEPFCPPSRDRLAPNLLFFLSLPLENAFG